MSTRLIPVITLSLLLPSLSWAQAEGPVDLSYNFVLTNRYGQDTLLIGPENEDIHIGVIGRIFKPVNTNSAARAQWPVGVWTATVSPPDDPPRIEWRYKLIFLDTEEVEFEELEFRIEYSHDLKTVTRDWYHTRTLQLAGKWSTTETNRGVIHFLKRNEAKARRIAALRVFR